MNTSRRKAVACGPRVDVPKGAVNRGACLLSVSRRGYLLFVIGVVIRSTLISRYYTPLHMHDATRNGVTHLAALRGDHLISDLRLTQVGRCLPDV
mgnify:CR=1 FL=1